MTNRSNKYIFRKCDLRKHSVRFIYLFPVIISRSAGTCYIGTSFYSIVFTYFCFMSFNTLLVTAGAQYSGASVAGGKE